LTRKKNRKRKRTSTLGEHNTIERKLYATFRKDESLLRKEAIDSLPISLMDSFADTRIYFESEVSCSNPI
jgi:hypothetical protein